MSLEQRENDDGLKDRILALSDGIFGFAMTLLVITLEVPQLPEQSTSDDLLGALLDLAPQAQSYVISFVVLGAYWIGHHRVFKYIHSADGRLAQFNVLYLMCIAFMPLPTAVLGDYSGDQVAVVLYAATLATASLLMWLIWEYAWKGRLVEPNLDPRLKAHNSLVVLLSAAVFVVSIGLSFWSPSAAMWSWLLTAAIHPILDRVFGASGIT
ncbi:MAG: DUF1211 domain-containing protein [Chloroflexota bacterium]|nr:MAG: DUF1211 domain-containing protein [Chloroflexota bacterium]